MQVKVRKNNIKKALQILKRKTGDIVYEARKREEYVKPSDKRRHARKVAELREKRRQAVDRRPA